MNDLLKAAKYALKEYDKDSSRFPEAMETLALAIQLEELAAKLRKKSVK